MRAFDVTVTLKDGEFVCTGPHGLLIEIKGSTEREAIDAYLEAAGEQMLANRETNRRDERLLGYAQKVNKQLMDNLSLTEL